MREPGAKKTKTKTSTNELHTKKREATRGTKTVHF